MTKRHTSTDDVIRAFEAKIIPEPNSGCWLWEGSMAGKGYGNFWNGAKLEYAHRFSYRTYVGPITEKEIDHKCRNRACVNPDHLEPVTPQENKRRAKPYRGNYRATNANALKTTCPRGHPYTGGNLYVKSDGSRHCRECLRDYQRFLRMKRGCPIRIQPSYDWSLTA